MLSIQGLICKDLKRQEKLPEKWNDIQLDTKLPQVALFNGSNPAKFSDEGWLLKDTTYTFRLKDGTDLDWVNNPWELTMGSYFYSWRNSGIATAICMSGSWSNSSGLKLFDTSFFIGAGKGYGSSYGYEKFISDKQFKVNKYMRVCYDPNSSTKYTYKVKIGSGSWTSYTYSLKTNPSNPCFYSRMQDSAASSDHWSGHVSANTLSLKWGNDYLYGSDV